MQTIQIQVKDNYVQNVVTMLGTVKDIMIDNIAIKYNESSSSKESQYFNKLSLDSLEKDWDNCEDAVYDKFL